MVPRRKPDSALQIGRSARKHLVRWNLRNGPKRDVSNVEPKRGAVGSGGEGSAIKPREKRGANEGHEGEGKGRGY